ncbi:hypothetical protein BTJ39_03625 [Izhakiella australiensis]|uniref:Hypersensitivity response secretion-like HrpJ domain-containing protein n=1 Tax=Izhakiella australiensis TaxID=1926881 RepID=A0A1S8YPS5_9GAMM|nr:HrpJ domain-containing protein [Izhakiella australiensis]OON41070.1 hypothetical protein BTJ39_03625 [Izhakiella australiensis]
MAGNMTINQAPVNNDLIESLQAMQDKAEVKVTYSTASSVAMTMADDMAALLSTFLQNRMPGKKNNEVATSVERACDAILAPERPAPISKIREFACSTGMNSKTFLAFMKQMYPDPMQLALLLQAMIRQKKHNRAADDDELADVPLELLEDTLNLLINGPGKKGIRAGLNTESQTRQYSSLLQRDEKTLRNMYYEFISLKQEPVVTYQEMYANFGADRIKTGLDYFTLALHSDINSHDPSCSKDEFGLLLEANYRLCLIKSASENFISSMLECEYLNIPASKIKNILIEFFINFVTDPEKVANHVQTFIKDNMAFNVNADKIAVIQHLRTVISHFPSQVFANELLEGARLKNDLDRNLLDMMDRLIRISEGGKRYE